MKDSNDCMGTEYRRFRQRILKDCPSWRDDSATRWTHPDTEVVPRFRTLRRLIREFRGKVRDSVRALMLENPDHEPLIRRALAIPAPIPLLVERWSCVRKLGQILVPLFISWREVQRRMNEVGTFEGREYLFDRQYKRMLGVDIPLFDSGVDVALRRLPLPSFAQLQTLRSLSPEWVHACFRVGMRSLAEMEPYARYGHYEVSGELALILIEEGVIARKEEFSWIKSKYEWRVLQEHCRDGLLWKSRQLVRVLRDHGIERQSIASVFQFYIERFNARRCAANLAVLQGAGFEDLTALYAVYGDKLWDTPTAGWSFVVDTLGARNVEDVESFRRLIDSHHPLSSEYVEALKNIGAGIKELAQCQSLILQASQKESPTSSIIGINVLADAPHSLTIQQLTQCGGYLSNPEKLPEYLAILARYGYGSAVAVLEFQKCYKNTSTHLLEYLLKLLGERKAVLTDVVDWVQQASKSVDTDAYDYLLSVMELPHFVHLQQVLSIAWLGRRLLTFLVERKGLRSIDLLRDWYYDEVKGIQGFRWWGRMDDAYLLLLDDAYARNNFSVVTGNQSAVHDVVRSRCLAVLGERFVARDEASRALYDEAYATLFAQELSSLITVLPKILHRTAGVVLKSILRNAWEPSHVIEDQLAALNPLIDQLLTGRGPADAVLNEMQADAISMVYRTSVGTVLETWPEVRGREADLAALTLQAHYAMTWEKAFRRLDGLLERRSLNGLDRAAAYAMRFHERGDQDIAQTCKGLRAKRLDDAARDPWSLAEHLGVMLAAAREDTAVAQWVKQDLQNVAQMAGEGAQAFERFEQLKKLFNSTLPDALNEHAERFLAGFSETDAAIFARRLVVTAQWLPGSGREQLREAFRQVRENVLETCLRWVAREHAKFVKVKTENLSTALEATLSKHPAAYFAKHAAVLCTRHNTQMWQESRQAHLLVFDPAQRRLAGMALVCLEPIPALHPTGLCLIVRAINPMDDMLAAHTASSIVETFFDVAIQIAEQNSLVAVAFPSHNGAHLLSNQKSIEDDIVARYMNKATTSIGDLADADGAKIRAHWRRNPLRVRMRFYAYEVGQEEVNDVFVLWQGDLPPARADRPAYAELDMD